jgi:pSer/pThr/pTyr-binding forkhead associated (FHA) protein
VITLTLLHPLQAIAVQSWEFEDEPIIRIGRATDNEVVLYSAVVSRHHVEIRKSAIDDWEVVNVGSNGTYIDGERVEKTTALDGMIVRLAQSGPKILLKIESSSNQQQFDYVNSQERIRRQPKSAKDTLISE